MTALQRQSDATPLYVQLAQILKERIHSGEWTSGSLLPTERELCAEFNVARGTMRQALQTLELEGYLRREQGRGTFVLYGQTPDAPSQSRLPRNLLAFIVPYVRDSSVSAMFMGFQQVAQQANYSVVFDHVNNDVRQQAKTIERLVQEGVAGIALYPVDSEAIAPIDQYVRAGFPIVLVDRYLKNLSSDFVMTDHFNGAIRGVRHLLDQGHQRLGFATWFSPAVSMEHRYLGYQQALRERGFEADPNWICYVQGYPTIDLTPLQQWLSRPNRVTAVFTANDQIAIALYRAAASLGLKVPRDLAVVGFDNLDVSQQLDPPLTTVAQPFMQIGQSAADILLRRVGGDRNPFYQLTMSPELILRGSDRLHVETRQPALETR
jgi:DNA-binding LacI/PurR family transcriptional regulator